MSTSIKITGPQEDILIRFSFPLPVFEAYRCNVEWKDDSDFEKGKLLDTLFHSDAFHDTHQPSFGKIEGAHGPFSVSEIQYDHFVPISPERIESEIVSRLKLNETVSATFSDEVSKVFPDKVRKLRSVLAELDGATHCFKLSLSLDYEQEAKMSDEGRFEEYQDEMKPYAAEWFEEMGYGILDHFEEWLAYNHGERTLWMLYLLRD